MKIVSKSIICFVVCIGLFFVISAQSSHAATSKVYSGYSVGSDMAKFPMTLSNGITIGKEAQNLDQVPTIRKGNTTLWTAKPISFDIFAVFNFTVTSNKDTYFYYHSSYRSKDRVHVIGVSAAGTVFLNKTFTGYGGGMDARFLSASVIQIGAKHKREYANYMDDSDFVYLGADYDMRTYQLYKNGTMKQLPFVDQTFATQARAGKLKGIPGKIGETHQTVRKRQNYGITLPAEGIFTYSLPDQYYIYLMGSNYRKIENNRTVRGIYNNHYIIGSNKTLGPTLKKYFGSPVNSLPGFRYYYKAGNYYVLVTYEDNTAQLAVIDRTLYNMFTGF